MRFLPEDYEHELVKSSCRFTRLENPTWRARLILRKVRKHLVEDEWKKAPGAHITDAVMLCDICISRVNSDLRV